MRCTLPPSLPAISLSLSFSFLPFLSCEKAKASVDWRRISDRTAKKFESKARERGEREGEREVMTAEYTLQYAHCAIEKLFAI